MNIQEKLQVIRKQLNSLITEEDTPYGVNPFNVQIIGTDILPNFNIAFIKIKYQENDPGNYLESNWYNNQIYEPLTFRDELDDIEVSIVNLNDEQGNELTQQLIIIS